MLVLVTGPTGSGKTTLVLKGAHLGIWTITETWTTRKPRTEPDTKRSISTRESTALSKLPGQLTYKYQGHLYGNDLNALRSGASPMGTDSAVDWVHPYPTDLLIYESAIGLVLHPSWDTLKRRLIGAGRGSRIERARVELDSVSIVARTPLPPRWATLDADGNPDEILTLARSLIESSRS